MSSDRTPEEVIQIPSIPPIKDKLIGQVDHPDALDKVTKDMGAPAYLLNFHCATPMDLSSIGLGKTIHVPVQVSQREGGRKSVFYLSQGEEVLVGIIVTNQGIALRFMKRETGNISPAETGDIYSTRITNREGERVFEGKGTFEITSPSDENAYFYTTTSYPIPSVGNGGRIVWTCYRPSYSILMHVSELP